MVERIQLGLCVSTLCGLVLAGPLVRTLVSDKVQVPYEPVPSYQDLLFLVELEHVAEQEESQLLIVVEECTGFDELNLPTLVLQDNAVQVERAVVQEFDQYRGMRM